LTSQAQFGGSYRSWIGCRTLVLKKATRKLSRRGLGAICQDVVAAVIRTGGNPASAIRLEGRSARRIAWWLRMQSRRWVRIVTLPQTIRNALARHRLECAVRAIEWADTLSGLLEDLHPILDLSFPRVSKRALCRDSKTMPTLVGAEQPRTTCDWAALAELVSIQSVCKRVLHSGTMYYACLDSPGRTSIGLRRHFALPPCT
jgi:hypothetical protein